MGRFGDESRGSGEAIDLGALNLPSPHSAYKINHGLRADGTARPE